VVVKVVDGAAQQALSKQVPAKGSEEMQGVLGKHD